MNTKKLAQYLKKSRKENTLRIRRTEEGLLITDGLALFLAPVSAELLAYTPTSMEEQFALSEGATQLTPCDTPNIVQKWYDWSSVPALGAYTPTAWLYEIQHYKKPSTFVRRLVRKEDPSKSAYFDTVFPELFDEDYTNLRDLSGVWRLDSIKLWPMSTDAVLRVMRNHPYYKQGEGQVDAWRAEAIIMPHVFKGNEGGPNFDEV